MTNDIEQSRGILAWFVKNHVAANLLMVFVIAAGLLSLSTIKVEFFPEMSLDVITVTVPYRGASPSEVEQGVTLRVEEAVASVDGIKRITSTSAEGASLVVIEVEEYADPSEVLDDVKAEIDRITTFPQETEKPVITEIKTRYEVLTLVLYGDVSERTLKEMADRVKDDLTALPNISQVDIAGVRPYEISVEISEETLRKYNLSFDQVSRAPSPVPPSTSPEAPSRPPVAKSSPAPGASSTPARNSKELSSSPGRTAPRYASAISPPSSTASTIPTSPHALTVSPQYM